MKDNIDNVKKEKKYDIIVLDGLNVAHRFHWVFNNFKDSKKRPTGMIYGVLECIRNLKNKHKNADIIFVWDSANLKKKEMNKDYKSDREKKPDEFYEIVDKLKELLSLYNIKQYYAYGYEADDLAARIIKENKNKNILLISSDTDWYIFMNENVDIYQHSKILTVEDVLKEIGLKTVNHFKMYLSIVGTHNYIKGIKIPKNKVIHILNHADVSSLRQLFDMDFEDNYINLACKTIHRNERVIKSNYELIQPLIEGYDIEEIKRENNITKLLKVLKDYEMNALVEKIKKEAK